jgi:hypothetical protein
MLKEALDLLRLRGVTLETLAAEARLRLAVVDEIVGGDAKPRLQLAGEDVALATSASEATL